MILSALAARTLHGYGLIEEVSGLSDGRVKLSLGTLYGALDRLTEDDLVRVAREEVVTGRLRRYYELTKAGRAAFQSYVDHLGNMIKPAAEAKKPKKR